MNRALAITSVTLLILGLIATAIGYGAQTWIK